MTDSFHRDDDGSLKVESVDLRDIAASFGTPAYVYSRSCIEQRWRQWPEALGDRRHLVCYAVKANSNMAILALMARLGAGFDIVSGGELRRVLAAGGDPARVVFSGVGKSREELELAVRSGLKGIHVESEEELHRLAALAQELAIVTPVAVRVCPEVEVDTHRHISTGHGESKFGMSAAECVQALSYAERHDWLRVAGIACHIGSQILSTEPFVRAAAFMNKLLAELPDIRPDYIDMGGGLGISYNDEVTVSVAELVAAISRQLPPGIELVLEPGRHVIAPAGVLLTRVEYVKPGTAANFVIVDAGMNDFIRPAMYDAWHDIEPVQLRDGESISCDVVGPVCESGDCFAKDRKLVVAPGDLLVIRDAGAYGATMACEYNSRPRACELLVDGEQVYQVRKRGDIEQMLRQEHIPDCLR